MAKESTKKKSVNTGELGGSGTTIYNGVVANAEYKSSLSTEYGGNGLLEFEKMRRSDPIVRGSLNIIKLAILQAEWDIEVPEDEPQGEEIQKFCREAIFERMDRPWNETLKDILTYMDFGYSVLEKVFKVEDDKIWWEKLSLRQQHSIVKFTIGKEGAKQRGITQRVQGDEVKKGNEDIEIPMEKVLIFSNEKEGENFRGFSVLRSAFKPYFFKINIEKIDAVGFEREAIGIPVFTMPANPTPEDEAMADKMGENLRAHEKAYVRLPFGWELDIKYPIGSSKRDPDTAIKRFNREIFSNVLAQFLDLGSGASGSRALSDDQSDAFYRSQQSVADYISSIILEYGLKQLIDLNFDNVKKYPKLKATGIEKINLDAYSNAIYRMVSSGVIVPDTELEDRVRKVLRLPKKSVDKLGVDDRKPLQNEQRAKDPNAFDPNENDNENVNKEKENGKAKTSKKDEASMAKGEKENKKKDEKKEKKIAGKFSEIDYYRPLYFAEEKVNFPSIQRNMDRISQEIEREIKPLLDREVESIVNQARFAITNRDIKTLDSLVMQQKENIRQVIQNKLESAYNFGKMTAADELSVDAPRTAKEVIDYITTQSGILSDRLMNDLLSNAKLRLSQDIQMAAEIDASLSALEAGLIDASIQSIGLMADVVTSGGIAQGRNAVFDANEADIHGKIRSEILDKRICGYCISMDGRVLKNKDPMTGISQFHFLCRGIWVAISKGEAELPEITEVPQELRRRTGSLSDFQQIKNPIPVKGGLAEEFLKNRK